MERVAAVSALLPFETLYDHADGDPLPLPPALSALYGALDFPIRADRPYVIANFVSTLDGVTSLGMPGRSSGSAISGQSTHDHALMGLLRAAADAIIVGAGTLALDGAYVWTAERIFPPLAVAYRELRAALAKPRPPTTVIVDGRGAADLAARALHTTAVPALIVTTTAGLERLRQRPLPMATSVVAAGASAPLSASDVLAAVQRQRKCQIILVEGGATLLGSFLRAHAVDELFLTLAPQIAGREAPLQRPGLVSGQVFAPDDPLWVSLLSLKRAGSHLFLRYALPVGDR